MPLKDPIARAEYQRQYQQRTDHAGKERQRYREDPIYKAQQAAYRRANAVHYAELQRDWRANNPREVMVINARTRAKKAGYPCTITVDDIDWVTHCPIFGLELDYNSTPTGKRMHAKRAAFPTLDKRDPFLGYTPGNVFVLSAKANRMKQDATVDQLRALLRYAEGAA